MNNLSEFTLSYQALEKENSESFDATGVIIVAAGSASRMKGINKILTPLLGVPVIARSALAFERNMAVTKIVIVTSKAMVADISRLAEEFNITKLSDIVIGGVTRQESVSRGFDLIVKDEKIKNVLIHDGARPLVGDDVICRVLRGVESFGAAIPTVPVKDTVKVLGPLGKIEATPSRATLAAAQTPQGFKVETYKAALKSMTEGVEYTDDSSIAEGAGIAVYSVEGDTKNIKITTPEDLLAAESILKNQVI